MAEIKTDLYLGDCLEELANFDTDSLRPDYDFSSICGSKVENIWRNQSR